MKLLLTGADGFTASRINTYYKSKYEIYAYNHHQMDFTELKSVLDIFSQTKPDLVIHCGAISSPAACENNPEYSYMVNVIGSENMAKACHLHHAKLIFFSSDQIYFESDISAPHTEEETSAPSRTYGRQKLLAEQLCSMHHSDTVSLRLSWMYDTQKSSPTEHGSLVTDIMESTAAFKTVSYPIYDFRSITNVWEMIKNLEQTFQLPGGTYNFGSPNNYNTYEIAHSIFLYLHYDTQLLTPDHTSFSSHPRNLRMDMTKTNSHGIYFPDTITGLETALKC